MKKVAIHEMGHAFQFIKEGCAIKEISIIENAKRLGGVTPCSIFSQKLTNDQHVKISLAGLIAELIVLESFPITMEELKDRVEEEYEWEDDWNRAREFALRTSGYINQDDNPPTDIQYETTDRLLWETAIEVRDYISLQKEHLENAVNILLNERVLKGDRLVEIFCHI